MASFRDIDFATYANRGDLTVPVPAGVQEGDEMVAYIARQVGSDFTPPAGWDLVDGYPVVAQQAGGGFQVNVWFYTRTATDTEPADYVWEVEGSAPCCGSIYASSDAGAPVFGTPRVNTHPGGVDDITADAIEVDPEALVVWAGLNWQLYGGSQTVPPGTTPTFTQRLKSGSSLQYLCDGVFSAGGDTGDRTQNGSNVGNDTDGWFGVMFAFPSASAPVTVPNVVGQSQSAATVMIGEAGLTLGDVTTGYSPSVPEGDVISQDPAGGTEVASGSAVDIVVSLGPEPASDPESDPDSDGGGDTSSDGDLPPDVIAEIWAFELSNGKTAAQNLVEINAALTAPIVGPYTLVDVLKVLAAVAAGQTRIDSHGGGAATVQFDSVHGEGVVVEASMQGSERESVSITPDGSS